MPHPSMWNLPKRIWPEEPSSPGCVSVCEAEPPRFPGRTRAGRDTGHGLRCGDRNLPYRPRSRAGLLDDCDFWAADGYDMIALHVTFLGLALVTRAAPRLPGRSGNWFGLLAVAVYRRWITRWTPACPDTAESCSEHARRVFRDLPAHEALAAIRARDCSAHGGTP